MSKQMERDLDHLRRSLLTMGAAVEQAVHTATKSLRDRNAALADACVEADSVVDMMENAIQEQCLRVLALHQPVAGDLRHVSAMLLMATDLERMGDLAVGVARRARTLARPPHIDAPPRLWDMAARATRMVRQSLDAFANSDPALARAVIDQDPEVDCDDDALVAEVTEIMKGSPAAIETGILMLSVVRRFERLADHATNVSEGVIYMVEGVQVRHSQW